MRCKLTFLQIEKSGDLNRKEEVKEEIKPKEETKKKEDAKKKEEDIKPAPKPIEKEVMKTIPLGKISNTESLDNKNIDNSNLGSSNNGKQQAAINDKNSSSFNNVKVNVQSTQAIGQNLNNENSEGMKIFLNNFNLKI